MELALGCDLGESGGDVPNQGDGDLECVVSGQDSAYIIALDALDRLVEEKGIGGGVEGVETALVHQISGEEIALLRLIEAAVSGGVARRVDDLELPAAQVQPVSIPQQPLGRAAIDLVCIRIEVRREIAGAV